MLILNCYSFLYEVISQIEPRREGITSEKFPYYFNSCDVFISRNICGTVALSSPVVHPHTYAGFRPHFQRCSVFTRATLQLSSLHSHWASVNGFKSC